MVYKVGLHAPRFVDKILQGKLVERKKVGLAFANIFMSTVETEIINKGKIKPLEWKRYIDDVFSLWDTNMEEIDQFILEANRHHPTIKFTAEISEEKTNF